MKIKLPENIQLLQSYKPGKPIDVIVKELGLKKTAVLWNNENNFGTSPKAIEAMQKAMHGLYLYPDPLSIQLREKLAEKFNRNTENIVIGNGSEGILLNIFKAFCSGNDELLTSEGSFVIIYIWSLINNTKCIKVPLTADYRFDLDTIASRINDNTKVIYLSNANNPTGSMITQTEFAAFMKRVPEHILVIADEAYFEYSVNISDDFANSLDYNFPNVITLRTFSKAYGVAGVRIGYAIANKDLIEPLLKVKLTFEPSAIAQAAGIGALDDTDFLDKTVKNNNQGLEYFYKHLTAIGIAYTPSYANFVMIDMSTADNATKMYTKLMENGVFVRQLSAFGLPHCIRVSVGKTEENELFIEKLHEIMEKKN